MKNKELSCYNKLPNETNKSFNEFTEIRDLPPHERNLRKVAEKNLSKKGIGQSRSNYPNELKREHKRLQKLSEKWLWQERFHLYDLDQQIELMQKRDDVFYNMNKALLDIVEGLIKYANNLLAELINGNAVKKNGDDFSLGTKIKMLNEITSIIKNANDLLCQLCGRPSEYAKLDINADVDAKVTDDGLTEEEREQKYEAEFKRLLQEATTTPNTDAQDIQRNNNK